MGFNSKKKIAIFRALKLGDLLCTVPAFRALRKAFPKDEIVLIGLPWANEFVKRFPNYFNDFITFPGYPPFPEQKPIIEKFPEFIKSCQEKNFDLLIQMQGDGTNVNVLIPLLGAKKNAGHATQDSFIPDKETFFPWTNSKHEIHIFLDLIQKLGFSTDGDYLEFPLFDFDFVKFLDLKQSENLNLKNYICIHPGGHLRTRRWPAKRFAVIADYCADKQFQIVLTGTQNEYDIGQEIIANMHSNPINLIGKTSLGTLGVLIQQAKMLISNDTGVSHIASALKTLSIIIIMGSDPQRYRPLDRDLHKIAISSVPCRPCFSDKCPFNMVCGNNISDRMVFDLIDGALHHQNNKKNTKNTRLKKCNH